ncbi:Cytochrome c oxidase subunit 7A, mitochondrial [Portunus trituberculatus]|uniref:Cytochrome c oxidase subunit 7A, mitochondrial n=1 Tax=Portunus trituberculatus TaxID=210409 RepID=A0A5B7EBX2_PORTR|nr:Cytochrome c oxidase subunit 7A, mitochondrial [Portunus trituberculatus]
MGLEMVALIRTLATTTTRTARSETHPGYNKLRSTMKEFQIDNGLPIHLKGGVMDNLLFLSTLGVSGIGLFMCFKFYFSMAFPPKKE